MPIREVIRQINPFSKNRGNPEVIAYEIVADVWTTMAVLMETQAHLFEELGQTRQERQDLAMSLATSLYASGMTKHSAKRLHVLLHEDELQDIVFDNLCLRHRLVVEQSLVDRLIKRPEYAAYVRRDPTKQSTTGSLAPLSVIGEAHDRVSTVPSDERSRSGGRRTARIGERRDPRRTSRCESRAVPTLGVPLRIPRRHAPADTQLAPALVNAQPARAFHPITLQPLL